MDNGIFATGDAEFIAEMLQAATVKFAIPQLISRLTLQKLEREFEGVMNLILHGSLRARRGSPAFEGAGQDRTSIRSVHYAIM